MKSRVGSTVIQDMDSLYQELLRALYDDGSRHRAEIIAGRFQKMFHDDSAIADSIRGLEIRSLIAEMKGDLPESIRNREAEIRKILELHSLSRNTPGWKYVQRQYDDSDVGDRLDLLATLYAHTGDLNRAIAILEESRLYCQSHGVPFDGADLIDEYTKLRARRVSRASHAPLKPKTREAPLAKSPPVSP